MIRIAMWSGPRNISTAMLRSWESRADTFVVDEPYYAYYLSQNDLQHPGREDVLREGELDAAKVSHGLVNDTKGNCSIYYQKHMTHHLLDTIDRDWIGSVTNCFLIRDPKDMIISYSKVHPEINSVLLGVEQQREIFEYVKNIAGGTPPIIDSKDILMNPKEILSKFCDRIDVEFSDEMLSWPKGPRDTDGNWGKYWYKNVMNSTGFNQYVPKTEEVPEKYLSLYEESYKLYQDLHKLRIR